MKEKICCDVIVAALGSLGGEGRIRDVVNLCLLEGYKEATVNNTVSHLVRKGVLAKNGWNRIRFHAPLAKESILEESGAETPPPAADLGAAIPWPTATRACFEQDRQEAWAFAQRGFAKS
ncbi:MAG: hypothetical protein WCG26_00215 [Chloroflexales bacterium]